MIPSRDLGILQWQCAYVFVTRRRKGLSLTKAELKLLLEMRDYFRAGKKPPQALVNRACSLLSSWQARRKGLLVPPANRTGRKARLAAAETRRTRAEEKARKKEIDAWRAELHKEAFE